MRKKARSDDGRRVFGDVESVEGIGFIVTFNVAYLERGP